MPAGDGQLLMLTVPNEKENAETTEIQITIPEGFDLEHAAPVPGWTAEVSGQHHAENGGEEGGNSITWKGKLSGEELAVLPFTGVPKNAGEYTFNVRQTYSDGSVVEWSGSEDSDTPAARIEATNGEASSGGSDDTAKTLGIIALVLGGVALVVGGVALDLRDGVRHEARRAGGRAARRLRGCAGAAGGGVGTRRAGLHATAGERRARPPAGTGQPHVQ